MSVWYRNISCQIDFLALKLYNPSKVATDKIKHGSECMYSYYFCCNYLILVVPIFKIQVVSGMKYYLTVEVGKTACEKSSGPMPFSEIQKCELLPSNQQEVRSDTKFTMSNEQICQMFLLRFTGWLLLMTAFLSSAQKYSTSLNCLLEDVPNKTSS